jgi:hypothetical protein
MHNCNVKRPRGPFFVSWQALNFSRKYSFTMSGKAFESLVRYEET